MATSGRVARSRCAHSAIKNVDIWRRILLVQVKKWGNSATVRIPASVMAAAGLRIDQAVDVREEGGRIVIEAVSPPSYDLDQLLASMSPDTFPDVAKFGRKVGGEAW
jgi:antitoxin MazE